MNLRRSHQYSEFMLVRQTVEPLITNSRRQKYWASHKFECLRTTECNMQKPFSNIEWMDVPSNPRWPDHCVNMNMTLRCTAHLSTCIPKYTEDWVISNWSYLLKVASSAIAFFFIFTTVQKYKNVSTLFFASISAFISALLSFSFSIAYKYSSADRVTADDIISCYWGQYCWYYLGNRYLHN